MTETIQLALTIAAAFVGALTGVGSIVWWLSHQFALIYKLIAKHELRNVERFRTRDLAIMRLELKAGVDPIAGAYSIDPVVSDDSP